MVSLSTGQVLLKLHSVRGLPARSVPPLSPQAANPAPKMESLGFIYHDSFVAPGAQQTIFGQDDQWETSPALDGASGAKQTVSDQEQAELFLKYNYARYMLSQLVENQPAPHLWEGAGCGTPHAAASPSRPERSERDKAATQTAKAMLTWYKKAMALRSQLVQANMGLVLAMAKRTRIPSLDFSELVSQGSMALLRSIENYDFSRGFKFSTYACRAILRSFGRLASESETHRRRFTTQPCLDIARSTRVDHDHERRWQDAIDSLREVMANNRAKLSEIERRIIIERFSMVSGGKGRTYEEIGKMIGLTSERIRQMHKLALRKIRAAFEHEQFGRPRRLIRQAG
jgi:RNA polymerase sigma factor (sigma-70 family)